MAEAAAAEMEQMKVEEEKKEVVTALAGAFGVTPPVDNGCVARARTLFRDRARACSRADPPTTIAQPRGRGDDRSAGIDARGSRVARAARARLDLSRRSPFPPLAPDAARAAHRPLSTTSRPTDPF